MKSKPKTKIKWTWLQFPLAETRRPHASLPTVFKVQPRCFFLQRKPWKRCSDYRWLMAPHCVPAGLYTAGVGWDGGGVGWGGGLPSHCGPAVKAFYAVQWRPFSTSAGSLPLCPLQPPSPIVGLNCRAGVVVTFFSFTVIQWTWTLLPATCELQHTKSSGWWFL